MRECQTLKTKGNLGIKTIFQSKLLSIGNKKLFLSGNARELSMLNVILSMKKGLPLEMPSCETNNFSKYLALYKNSSRF